MIVLLLEIIGGQEPMAFLEISSPVITAGKIGLKREGQCLNRLSWGSGPLVVKQRTGPNNGVCQEQQEGGWCGLIVGGWSELNQ